MYAMRNGILFVTLGFFGLEFVRHGFVRHFLHKLSRAHAQRRVIVVGRFVGRSVSQSVPTFSVEPWLLQIPNVDMWVCATGARHSKSLERRCPRTVCLRRGPKIIYSCYTRCALIRDRRPTAWDGFARPAETKVCIMSVE